MAMARPRLIRHAPEPAPTTPHVAGRAERIAALDPLRAAAMIAVVAAHAGMGYTQFRIRRLFWAVREPGPDLTWDLVVWWTISTALPLFFVLGGYAVEALRQRRGTPGMLRDRFRRIGLPFLVAIPAILGPTRVIWCYGWYAMGKSEPDQFLGLVAPPEWLARLNFSGPAHLWFLEYLACWIVAIAILGPALDRLVARFPARWLVSPWAPFALAVPTTLLLWANRWSVPLDAVMDMRNSFVPNPTRWLHHGVFFLVGIGLYRARDHWRQLERSGPALLAAAVFAFVARSWMLRLDGGGPPLRGLDAGLLALTGGLYGWLAVYGCLGTALRTIKRTGPVVKYLADSSYWVYLIHFPVVGLAQADLCGVSWPIAAKFWASLAAGLVAGLATYPRVGRPILEGLAQIGAPGRVRAEPARTGVVREPARAVQVG